MSTPINDGGPAFPVSEGTNMGDGTRTLCGYPGLAVRDYFAGQALAGFVSSWYDRHAEDEATKRGAGPELIAMAAYIHADAMIAERAKGQQ